MLPIARRGLLGAAAALVGVPALAYPERPLRWVVAYPAGGGSDSLARLIGAELAKLLGQSVIIDNRPGAGATLGADAVAKSAPDGHTVFSGDAGSMVNNIALFRRLPYDPVRDFRAVGLFADFPLVIAVPESSPYRHLAAFVAAARANPGAIPCGTPGVGSPHHLAVERFQKEAKLQLTLVPYRGGALGVNDLLAGTLPSMMVDIATAGASIKAGRIRALAQTMPTRWRSFGDVPTIRESGLPDYAAPVWQGMVAPAGTPDAVVATLSTALGQIMAQPAIQNRMIEIGVEPLHENAAVFDARMVRDRAYWVPLIRELGITLDA